MMSESMVHYEGAWPARPYVPNRGYEMSSVGILADAAGREADSRVGRALGSRMRSVVMLFWNEFSSKQRRERCWRPQCARRARYIENEFSSKQRRERC
jgi:hypothetical protein